MQLDGNDARKPSFALTRADAERIFVTHYFRKPRLAELPASVQASVFDMYVNAGANAVKILQQLVTRMGFAATADGMIGPRTILAARQADAAAQGYLADAYGIARRNYYYALADGRPASRKYARSQSGGKGGWITRHYSNIAGGVHSLQMELACRGYMHEPAPEDVDEHSWPTPYDPEHASPVRNTLQQVLGACLEFATRRNA